VQKLINFSQRSQSSQSFFIYLLELQFKIRNIFNKKYEKVNLRDGMMVFQALAS